MLGLMFLWSLWADPPTETVCRVEVMGIPASVRPDHELVWPGGRATVDDVVKVRFEGPNTSVAIRGPRYQGAVYLSASQCSVGARRLDAHPRPASIHFRCAPPGLVVRCKRCPGASGRWVLAEYFPALAMTGYIREVDLEFKAVGYRGAHKRVIVYPGLNLLDVQLEEL